MFDFMFMSPFEQRKIDRTETEKYTISTVAVNDGNQPYETAIEHKDYGSGWVVVESYDTSEEAAAGHKKWAEKAEKDELGEKLVDNKNSAISQMFDGEISQARTTKVEANV